MLQHALHQNERFLHLGVCHADLIWQTNFFALQQYIPTVSRRQTASETRIINKYPNRRLYDTVISRYITLDEIRQLVLKNVDFKVIDKRSKDDITRSILLQVIMEQEEAGTPILREEVLLNIIRFYGDSMQHSVSHYLELSMELFVDQQAQFKEQVKQVLGSAGNPLHALKELADQNLPLWRKVRQELLKNIGLRGDSKDRSDGN